MVLLSARPLKNLGSLGYSLAFFLVCGRLPYVQESVSAYPHDMPLLCTVKGLLSLLPARSLGRLGILGLNHFPGSGRLSSSPLMRSLATLAFCC